MLRIRHFYAWIQKAFGDTPAIRLWSHQQRYYGVSITFPFIDRVLAVGFDFNSHEHES